MKVETKDTKEGLIAFRANYQETEKLRTLAKLNQTSMSEIIRKAINKY